jgi:Protein of unknown function, DUF417
MAQSTNHSDLITSDSSGSERITAAGLMNPVIDAIIKLGILKKDLDYHLIRASMVIIFLFFGYQKWFQYEAQVLIPYISNGPLIFWLHPVFGIRGATWFLGPQNGRSGHSCFSGSGIRDWEFSERSAQVLPSYVRSQLFHLFRMAGRLLPAAFRR